MTIKTFYFNTGITPLNNRPLYGRQVWRGGTKQIPFTCDNVPDEALFLFACDYDKLPEASHKDVIVREILDNGPGGMLSKFAYFKIKS